MEYKVTRYENYGQGYIKEFSYKDSEKECKSLVEILKKRGFKRVKGSGFIGLTYEGKTQDKMGKVQITIERVVD